MAFRCSGPVAMTALVLMLTGCAKSPLIEGNEAFRSGDVAAAEASWLPLAVDGDVDAQHNLGVLNAHLGDSAAAAQWWRLAAAQEFVPSMRSLARLELASGHRATAIALFRRAARWGDHEAAAALESLDAPVPNADFWLARVEQVRQQRIAAQRHGRRFERLDSNEWWEPWNRFDGQAALAD